MVNTQHTLLTKHLGINHLYAVAGISMGGMQTYQWMASYPEFFQVAIPIVGSPRLTSYDRLLFELFQRVMKPCELTDHSDMTITALMLEYVVGTTPAYRLAETAPNEFPDLLTAIEEEAKHYDLHNLLSQMKAIAKHDITLEVGSLEKVSQNFRGKVLMIAATQDHMLLPTYATQMAQEHGDKIMLIDSDCGHYIFACEQDTISEATRNFLRESFPTIKIGLK